MVSISVDYKYDMFIQCEMAPEAEMQGQGPHSAQGGRVGLRARSLGFEGQCVAGCEILQDVGFDPAQIAGSEAEHWGALRINGNDTRLR